MNITVTINEPIWQNRANGYNAEKKAQHDAEQAKKPENERVEYQNVSVEDYFKARVQDVEDSYKRQIASEGANVLQAPEVQEVLADPVQQSRLLKILQNPDLRQQVADLADSTEV